MEKQFVYKEKFSFSYFYPFIAFLIIAVLCGIFRYGIAFGNLRLLAYPNSLYVTGGIALLFLIYAVYKMNKSSESRKNPNPITVGQSGITFPKGSNKESVSFADIEKAVMEEDEDDGKSYVITANGKSYSFFEERFESEPLFKEFVEGVEAKVTKK